MDFPPVKGNGQWVTQLPLFYTESWDELTVPTNPLRVGKGF